MMDDTERNLCYFRNLVHTVYREIRHIGPQSDPDANLRVTSGPFYKSAVKCSMNRAKLKGRGLFEMTAKVLTCCTDGVIRPYKEVTGPSLTEVAALFALEGWQQGYGGPRWAEIANTQNDLREALNASDAAAATAVCNRVRGLRHNTNRVVPTREEWERKPYLKEKWPKICE